MTGLTQVAAQKFTAVPRAVNNGRNKYAKYVPYIVFWKIQNNFKSQSKTTKYPHRNNDTLNLFFVSLQINVLIYYFSRYRPASEQGSVNANPRIRRAHDKRHEIQPFAVSMPEEEKRQVNLDWHLQEVVDRPVTISVDAQTDEYSISTKCFKKFLKRNLPI